MQRAGGPGRKSLVARVSAELRDAVRSGALAPGDRLPSEAGLTQQYAVSRTVVREAIASLRADGLVEPRHGVGVFVLEPKEVETGFKPVDRARISSMIELLELRAAVEIEAAGLAAERRSPAQEEAVFECFDDLERLIAAGEPTVSADLAFHLAIADATSNPRFREFLSMMGEHLIPRSTIADAGRREGPDGYLEQIQQEHRKIALTISERDADAARQAVRIHLKGSQDRYRRMIRSD
ncbi:FadR family transcriptional regulator [Pararhizobium mangrovi]|uniref:FadR family transcriptional regulator n=1 Tax=Pararhizobium mangrovi TaxID=2590452 RepID=A0A506UAH8_9HYPH|nr:FadR family transcriptional regulator [Pararhizobium mangrovi]